jgi:predicted  nucleic acid-binding Zn-ribbon protein
MSLAEKILDIIEECGHTYKDKGRSIHTECPSCGRSDKFSILKANGACICYRGSCDFGKRWFEDWMMLAGNMTRQDARKRLYGELSHKRIEENEKDPGAIFRTFKATEEESKRETVRAIEFPEYHMISINSSEAAEAQEYLRRRGVSLELAVKHNMHYSPSHRRVIFPVVIDGRVCGWQGRHIDPVDDKLRMRNNVGFRREILVMFADQLKNSDYAIVCEGPFDALKFDKVGGYVATMGKSITDHQLETILSYGPKKIYLALDDDATQEMREMKHRVDPLPVYRIFIPESCVSRCEAIGKKADFGECTLEECEEAFRNAVSVDESYTPFLFKLQGD